MQPPGFRTPRGINRGLDHIANWDTIRPIPTPSTAIDQANAEESKVGSMVPSNIKMATALVMRPVRTMPRTENRLDSRDPSAAAMNMVMDTGSILIPVSSASRPRTSCRYSGTDEEDTHEDQILA